MSPAPAEVAERLLAALDGVELIRSIVVLEETGSTNDDLRRLAAEGAAEGTVVIASRQTAGRGRLGRRWDSPDQLGLYLSLLLRPSDPIGSIGRYSIASAVAACEACREIAGDTVGLKWPNDVLAAGAKLAGVLSEMRQNPGGVELILGFGVNCNQRPLDFPPALRESATSLRILRGGVSIERETVAATVLRSLSETVGVLRRNGWSDVSERFLRYAPHANGRRVRLLAGGEGTTAGLDPTGALRVLTSTGVALVHAAESVAAIGD